MRLNARTFLILSSLFALHFFACRRQNAPATAARQAASAEVAARIITLTPSLTETVFALGAGARIVGVSEYCDYPPAAASLPRVGTFLQPNLEKILALRPDLVLADGVQTDIAAAL